VPAPDPDRHPDRDPPRPRGRPPPYPVPGGPQAHRPADRRGAAVPRPDAALAGPDVRGVRAAFPHGRSDSNQPDLAMGALPPLPGYQRRPARLVSGLADRRAAPDAELRCHDRSLHAGTEPVLGWGVVPPVRARGAGRVPVDGATPDSRLRLPQRG